MESSFFVSRRIRAIGVSSRGQNTRVGWVTGALDLDGREKKKERERRAALLVIKVKPGIRVKETPLLRWKEVGERRRSDGVAISEMAVKINEWKSSLSFSRVAVELGQTVCHASAVGEQTSLVWLLEQ